MVTDELARIGRGWRSALFDGSVSSRFLILVGVLMMERIPVTFVRHPWFVVMGTKAFAATFCFVAVLFFGRSRLQSSKHVLPFSMVWVAVHVCAFALYMASDLYLLHFAHHGTSYRCALFIWYASLPILPISLAQALFGLRGFVRVLRTLGTAWACAALCAVAMILIRDQLRDEWDSPVSRFGPMMQAAAFRGVKALLDVFYTGVVSDPANAIIGTDAYSVQIQSHCSGIEGLALGTSLTVGWLLYSRRELNLFRASLLVPVSLILIWLFNLVRITALIAIGNAGYPTLAMGGFHSEAGAILFSTVIMGFLFAVNRVGWFRLSHSGSAIAGNSALPASISRAERNVAAIYLLPFLSILMAGMIADAVSDGFEWLYCLRLIAALAVVYAYRREYRRMDWQFGWLGPAAGVVVFAFWIVLDRWMNAGAHGDGAVSASLAASLARLTTGQRIAWIVTRTIAAVFTVPLAEELAFRGFIARRFISADVESVQFESLTLVAVFGSSLIFGVLHGRMWLAGMLAGAVFAVVAKLRGRLGEAVAAHATANLMIAIWVLLRSDYSLW